MTAVMIVMIAVLNGRQDLQRGRVTAAGHYYAPRRLDDGACRGGRSDAKDPGPVSRK